MFRYESNNMEVQWTDWARGEPSTAKGQDCVLMVNTPDPAVSNTTGWAARDCDSEEIGVVLCAKPSVRVLVCNGE